MIHINVFIIFLIILFLDNLNLQNIAPSGIDNIYVDTNSINVVKNPSNNLRLTSLKFMINQYMR